MRPLADRKPSKNVSDVPNGKLINILTEKLEERRQYSRPILPAKERWPCVCRDLFLRVLKLTNRLHMTYGKGTNKGKLF